MNKYFGLNKTVELIAENEYYNSPFTPEKQLFSEH